MIKAARAQPHPPLWPLRVKQGQGQGQETPISLSKDRRLHKPKTKGAVIKEKYFTKMKGLVQNEQAGAK